MPSDPDPEGTQQDDTLLQDQLDTLRILRSMFPLPSELVLSPALAAWLPADEDNSDLDLLPARPAGLDSLEFSISIATTNDPERAVKLTVGLLLRSQEEEVYSDTSASHVAVGLRQPAWLTRSEHERLLGLLRDMDRTQEASALEYVLECVEVVRDGLASLSLSLEAGARSAAPTRTSTKSKAGDDGRLERVWYWFPSLSSKEKRRDLVDYAEKDGLTGFVLAGKPGLLCVEGPSHTIDRYMSSIKSESWSDIPPHQKKVSERKRDPLADGGRRFQTMRDITALVPTYGQYNHRGEMGEVRRLMTEWGVGADFAAVVLQAG